MALKNVVNKMIFDEGIKSFYKGFIPNIMLSSYGIIYFFFYENLKSILYINNNRRTQIFAPFFMGIFCKILTTTLIYPLNVIRTRSQKEQIAIKVRKECLKNIIIYQGFLNTIKQIMKNEGIRGFYKGYFINLIKSP